MGNRPKVNEISFYNHFGEGEEVQRAVIRRFI